MPIALFVITVLSLLVLGMSQLLDSSAQSVGLQVQSQRAFLAAQSGAQTGVALALDNSSCTAVPSSLTFSADGLQSCGARLSCTSLQADIDGNSDPETVYTLVSEGRCGAGQDFASRTVEVRVR
ncbi:MAG: hypothetical protein R3303_14310 [Marinobacter sp.]|nr:hypothetical protein [Marinobacter sp.]